MRKPRLHSKRETKMPYADKEKQRAYYREYQQRPKRKAYKKQWNEQNQAVITARQRARYKADPEKYSTYFRNRYVIRTYGITQQQYEEMFQQQGGVCGICGSQPDIERHGISRLAIDHCHSTGKIRGLLCNNCNAGMGLIGDTAEHLKAALAYLERIEAKGV